MADSNAPGTSNGGGREEEEINCRDQEQALNHVLDIVVRAWLVEQMYVPNGVPLSVRRHRLFARVLNELARKEDLPLDTVRHALAGMEEGDWPFFNSILYLDTNCRRWLYLMAVAYRVLEFLLLTSTIELSRFPNLYNAVRASQLRMAENAGSNFGNLFLTEEALARYRAEVYNFRTTEVPPDSNYPSSQQSVVWPEEYNRDRDYSLARYFEWLFRTNSQNQTLNEQAKQILRNQINIILGRENANTVVSATVPAIPRPPETANNYNFAPPVEIAAEIMTAALEILAAAPVGGGGGRLTRSSRHNPTGIVQNAVSYGFRIINGSVLDEGDQRPSGAEGATAAPSGRNSPPLPPSIERLRKKRRTTESLVQQETESREEEQQQSQQQQQQQMQMHYQRLREVDQQELQHTVRQLEGEAARRISTILSEAEVATNLTAAELQAQLIEVTERYRQEKESLENNLETLRRQYEADRTRFEETIRQRDAENKSRTEAMTAEYDSSMQELSNNLASSVTQNLQLQTRTNELETRATEAETRAQQLQERLFAVETTATRESVRLNGQLVEANRRTADLERENVNLEAQTAISIQRAKDEERARCEAAARARQEEREQELRGQMEASMRELREQLRSEMDRREEELRNEARSAFDDREQRFAREMEDRERELNAATDREAQLRDAADNTERRMREEAAANLADREGELRGEITRIEEEARTTHDRLFNEVRRLTEENERLIEQQQQPDEEEEEEEDEEEEEQDRTELVNEVQRLTEENQRLVGVLDRERQQRAEEADEQRNAAWESMVEERDARQDRERELRQEAQDRERQLREEAETQLANRERELRDEMERRVAEARTERGHRIDEMINREHELRDEIDEARRQHGRLADEVRRLTEAAAQRQPQQQPPVIVIEDDDTVPVAAAAERRQGEEGEQEVVLRGGRDPREIARRDETRIFNLQEPLDAAGQRLPNDLYMRVSEDEGMLACVTCRICMDPYNNTVEGRRIVFGFHCSHIVCRECFDRIQNGCPTCRARRRQTPIVDILLGEMGRRYAAWASDATVLHSVPPIVATNAEAAEDIRRRFWDEVSNHRRLLQEAEETQRAMQGRITELEERLAELEGGAAGTAHEEDQLREELRLLQEQCEHYRAQYLERVNAFNDLQAEYVTYQTSMRNNEDQEAELRNTIMEHLESAEHLQQDLEDVRLERDQNGQQLAGVRLQLDQTVASKDQELNQLRQEKESLNAKLREAGQAKETELNRLRNEKDAELNRVKDESNAKEAELRRVREESNTSVEQRNQTDAELRRTQEELNRIRAERDRLTNEKEELTRENATTIDAVRLSLDSDINTLNLENDALRAELRGIREELSESQATIQSLEDGLKQYQFEADTEVDEEEEGGRMSEGGNSPGRNGSGNNGGGGGGGYDPYGGGGSSSIGGGSPGGGSPHGNSGSAGDVDEPPCSMTELYSLLVSANHLLMGLQEEREDPERFRHRANRKRAPTAERENRPAVLEPFVQRGRDDDGSSQVDVSALTHFYARSVAPQDYKRSYDLLSIVYLNRVYKFEPSESAYSYIENKLVFVPRGSPNYLFFNFQISAQPIEFSRHSSQARKNTQRMFKAFLYAWTTVTSKNIHYNDLASALKLMKSQAPKFVTNCEDLLSYLNRCNPAIRFSLCGGLVGRPIFYRSSDLYDPPVALLNFANERDWFWQRVLGPLRQKRLVAGSGSGSQGGRGNVNPRIVIGFLSRGDPIYDVPLFVFQGERDSLMTTRITLRERQTVYCFDRAFFNSADANMFGWPCGPSPANPSPVDCHAAGLIDATSTTWVELREHTSNDTVSRFVVKLSDIAQTYQERQDLQLEKSARNYNQQSPRPGTSTDPD